MPGTMKRIAIATAVLCFALPAWGASGTRVSSFEYDPATGLLLKEIVEPDTAQLRLDTTYVRDGYGNKTSATISSPATGEAAIVSRSATATFDSQGRFNTVTTNALSHSETKAYDTRFGLPTSHTSPNSQVSQWQYDGFGRKTLEIAPDGNRTQFQYLFCSGVAGGSATCPTNAKYVVRATPRAADGVTQNGPIKSVYFDALDREIRSETQGFDGTQIVTAKQFDTRGRLLQASRPYFSSQTPKWIAYQYDDLARMTRQTEPNNAITQYAYNGLVYTVTNALNQTRVETKNSQGKVVTVKDHLNGTTTFGFDPFENLTKVTDAAGNVSTMGYDIRGRKTSMTDPDMGAWTYVYDAVGQMVRQVDAKAQEIVTGYDKLGRMTSRTSIDLSSSWTYDTATNGIGKVASMTTTAGFAKSLTYDSLSRPSQSTTTIDGQTYTSTSTYDANGRLATVVYPSGFTVRYVYTALGYQAEARNDATNALFWRADTMNAELQLTAFTHGNNVATTQVFDANTGRLTSTQAGAGNTVQNAGYVWDTVGNMTQRADATQALVETFLHDGLNRLTSSEIFGSPAKTVTYNAIGNIVTKSDVGTYTYPTTGSARPHAVASIAGSVTTSFTYDANGNMLTGNARTLTWTSFNMPATIARGASTVAFTYDPEYNRIKQTTPDGATHYLWDSASGINIEKFIGSGGSTQWSNYVFAAGQMVAVFYERTPGPSATRYFHKDHLGSLAVITDEAGAVSERVAYDSWGKRRHANGADDPGEAITSQANRGYTGHEHLEEVGLVHMNGRIYEPLVARFMSSDPIVQDRFSTQSLNRYSYVMNNPMAHMDPTGFQSWDLGGGFGISFGVNSSWGYDALPYWNGFLFQQPVQELRNPETTSQTQPVGNKIGLGQQLQKSFSGENNNGVRIETHLLDARDARTGESLGKMLFTIEMPGAQSSPPGATIGPDTNFFRTTMAGRLVDGFVGYPLSYVNALRHNGHPVSPLSGNLQTDHTGLILEAAGFGIGKIVKGVKTVVKGVDARSLFRSHSIEGSASSRSVNRIADSMRENGYVGSPIDVITHDGKMIIVDGHHRAAAAVRTNTKVDVHVLSPEDIPGHPSSWQSFDDIVESSRTAGPNRLTPPGKYGK